MLLSVTGIFYRQAMTLALTLDILIVAVVLLDYRLALRWQQVSATVSSGRIFSIGAKNNLTLTVTNHGRLPLQLDILPDIPQSWREIPENSRHHIPPFTTSEKCLAYIPMRRGTFRIERLNIRFPSPYRLLRMYIHQPVSIDIEVYPNVKAISHYVAMSRLNRLYELGIHRQQLAGTGTDIEYLREYRDDDDSRHIDWKASTRGNKLVSKVFGVESNSLVALVLDCGRMMTSEQEGLSALDHAVNAALVMCYMAEKIGDRVTLFAFSDRIISECPPIKGKNILNRASKFLTKLQPEFVESDYKQMFEHLKVRLKRRALVVFFSDLIDDINYTLFQDQFMALRAKHLPLMILLKDLVLEQNAENPPETPGQVYSAAAAADMVMRRAEAIQKLRQKRIHLLDVLPKEATPALIDKYLYLKSRNLV
jgi:uncharacterized protein (DUF58 family)